MAHNAISEFLAFYPKKIAFYKGGGGGSKLALLFVTARNIGTSDVISEVNSVLFSPITARLSYLLTSSFIFFEKQCFLLLYFTAKVCFHFQDRRTERLL